MRRGLIRVEDLTPGNRVQSRGDSDTLALPAGTKSVQEPEASVGSSTVAARGHIDELCHHCQTVIIVDVVACSFKRLYKYSSTKSQPVVTNLAVRYPKSTSGRLQQAVVNNKKPNCR